MKYTIFYLFRSSLILILLSLPLSGENFSKDKFNIVKNSNISYPERTKFPNTSPTHKNIEVALDDIKFMMPINGKMFSDKCYKGVYIKPSKSSEIVRAAFDGKVIFVDYLKPLGKILIIQHPSGYKTTYAQMGKITVKKGSYVKKGDSLGLPLEKYSVYFEIRKNYKCINLRKEHPELFGNG